MGRSIESNIISCGKCIKPMQGAGVLRSCMFRMANDKQKRRDSKADDCLDNLPLRLGILLRYAVFGLVCQKTMS